MACSLIFEEFANVVKTNPSKSAVIFKLAEPMKDNNYHTVSYDELYSLTIKLGNLLLSKGLKKQDNIAILLDNQVEWPIAFMATQYISAVAVPIHINLTPREIQQLVLHSQSKIILTNTKIFSNIKDIKSIEILIIDYLKLSGELTSSLSGEKNDKNVPLQADQVAAMFYSSGTTDLPKAILLSQKNILSNVQSLKKLKLANKYDTFISFLPLHHTYSFMATCLLPLLLGAQISYPTSINSADLLTCIRETNVSILVAVPQFFSILNRNIKEKIKGKNILLRGILNIIIKISWVIRKYSDINLSKFVLSELHHAFGNNIRFMITGGAPLASEIITDFFKWGFTILEGYGLTETSPVATFNTPENLKIGSVGKPIPGVQIKILEHSGSFLPPNAHPDPERSEGEGSLLYIGEIAIKGPNVMPGYYKLPEETRKAIKDGWFHTGDLGYLDKDGYLYIKGRKDELIVLASGKKVNPEEIEKHYSSSLFIKELCVFTSDKNGKQLMAVIIPNEEYFKKTGQTNIEGTIRWELENFTHKLSSYMRIKGFVISKKILPRTPLGKLMRYKIQQEYLKETTSVKREETVDGFDEKDKLLTYLSNRLKKKVKLSDHLELDLGIDSLGRIELLLDLQTFIGIKVPEPLMAELFYTNTIRELIQKVKPFLPKEIQQPKKEELLWSDILKNDPPTNTLKSIRLKSSYIDKIITFLFLGFLYILFKIFFILKVKGKENLKNISGPCIIYANHSTYLDGFIIASSLPFKLAVNCYFIGLREYFIYPIIKNISKFARIVPIDISFDLVNTLQVCSYLLKHSKIICYFPEGQRSSDGEITAFKKGIGILAKELNIPLIPVYLEGAFKAWPRHRSFPRPARIKNIFGKKLNSSDLLRQEDISKENVYELLTEKLRNELLKMK